MIWLISYCVIALISFVVFAISTVLYVELENEFAKLCRRSPVAKVSWFKIAAMAFIWPLTCLWAIIQIVLEETR